MSLTRSVTLAAVLLALVTRVAAEPPRADVDALVARAMTTFEVPGLAVTVVKDGRVVHIAGYGVRKLGESAPVEPTTVFGIASNTKAFIAAALAILVDEGRLSWDDRVIDHLPGFAMYDPYVTHEMRVRDLLCHRSGLGPGAGDLLSFPTSSYSTAEIVHRLRFIAPASSFRTTFAYSNLMFVVAGEVIRAVTGEGWDAFIRERIFAPLGMTASNTSVTALRASNNVVTPHERMDGTLQTVDYLNLDNVGAAGAINSNVADMAKWMLVQLDRGRLPGGEARLFSERQSREMWSPQTIVPTSDAPGPLAGLRPQFASYALGWSVRDYRGLKIVTHSGGLIGMTSRVLLVPEARLGITALSNSGTAATTALAWSLVDLYLEKPPTDWVAAFKEQVVKNEAEAREAVAKATAARPAASTPSLPLASYAGRYTDPWYGESAIALEGDHLVLRFGRTPGLVGELEHFQHDAFVARWRDRSLNADAYVTFALKPDGSVERFTMAPVSPATDFSFDFQDLLFTPVKKDSTAPAR